MYYGLCVIDPVCQYTSLVLCFFLTFFCDTANFVSSALLYLHVIIKFLVLFYHSLLIYINVFIYTIMCILYLCLCYQKPFNMLLTLGGGEGGVEYIEVHCFMKCNNDRVEYIAAACKQNDKRQV